MSTYLGSYRRDDVAAMNPAGTVNRVNGVTRSFLAGIKGLERRADRELHVVPVDGTSRVDAPPGAVRLAMRYFNGAPSSRHTGTLGGRRRRVHVEEITYPYEGLHDFVYEEGSAWKLLNQLDDKSHIGALGDSNASFVEWFESGVLAIDDTVSRDARILGNEISARRNDIVVREISFARGIMLEYDELSVRIAESAKDTMAVFRGVHRGINRAIYDTKVGLLTKQKLGLHINSRYTVDQLVSALNDVSTELRNISITPVAPDDVEEDEPDESVLLTTGDYRLQLEHAIRRAEEDPDEYMALLLSKLERYSKKSAAVLDRLVGDIINVRAAFTKLLLPEAPSVSRGVALSILKSRQGAKLREVIGSLEKTKPAGLKDGVDRMRALLDDLQTKRADVETNRMANVAGRVEASEMVTIKYPSMVRAFKAVAIDAIRTGYRPIAQKESTFRLSER